MANWRIYACKHISAWSDRLCAKSTQSTVICLNKMKKKKQNATTERGRNLCTHILAAGHSKKLEWSLNTMNICREHTLPPAYIQTCVSFEWLDIACRFRQMWHNLWHFHYVDDKRRRRLATNTRKGRKSKAKKMCERPTRRTSALIMVGEWVLLADTCYYKMLTRLLNHIAPWRMEKNLVHETTRQA